MKKFYARYIQECYKDEIIVYARNKREAQLLAEKYMSEIDWDYASETIKVVKSSPREKFDKDDTYIIRKTGITKPKLKPVRDFIGDLLYNVWNPDRDIELAYLSEKDKKEIRKNIKKDIESRVKKGKLDTIKSKLKKVN